LLDDALRLQDAGSFAVVLECIPGNVAAAITETLEIPTIGKSCWGYCDWNLFLLTSVVYVKALAPVEELLGRFLSSMTCWAC
jgi:3-methyl-2-oxobutanoate hydroxymethyltransferase